MRVLPSLILVMLGATDVAMAEPPIVNPANGHIYLLTPTPMSWQSARDFATSAGGYLVSIESEAEQVWVEQTFGVSGVPSYDFWIGLTDEAEEGTFRWQSGNPVTFTFWASSEPNNFPSSPNGEDYVYLGGGDGVGRWWDAPSPFYNGNPMNLFGIVEVSSPANVPTRWEVSEGGNGHRYEVVAAVGQISWAEARDAAVARGGALASLETTAENTWVFDHVVLTSLTAWRGDFGPWIGAFQNHQSPTYVEPSGGWEWVSGEPWTFSAWVGTSPDNAPWCSGGEDYGHYVDHTARWNDLGLNGCPEDSTYVVGYVVEYPDCPPDFNGNGVLSVQDIFDFLAAYFGGEFRADFNGSMSLTVQDIFDFLAAYFAGCP